MKHPRFDWKTSSRLFEESFESNSFADYGALTRANIEFLIIGDISRAQRLAATGLRHLRAILEANTRNGIRDRWRRDALAPTYFGNTSSIANMKAVHRRLERAHRRLRDDVLTLQMRAPENTPEGQGGVGSNSGYFLSPRKFALYPLYGSLDAVHRSVVLIHELLHEWLTDQTLHGRTVYGGADAMDLARRDPKRARRNPSNFQHFLWQVWADSGLDAPSHVDFRDRSWRLLAEAPTVVTGALVDRPVSTPAIAGGRGDLVVTALRARDGEGIIPTIMEVDANSVRRRGSSPATGATSFAPSLCTLPDGRIVAAVRGTSSKRLKLIIYQTYAEEIARVGDSGDLFGDVYSHPDLIAVGGGRMVVVMKGKSGKMKVALVQVSDTNDFARMGDGETYGPISDHGVACLIAPVDHMSGPTRTHPAQVTIATAMRTREGKMSLILWSADYVGRQVRRLGDLEDVAMEGRPAITALISDSRSLVITAVRDAETNRLRLTAFDVSDPTRPIRLAETGDNGPSMSHSPDIKTLALGSARYAVTASRHALTGGINLSLWSPPVAEDDNGEPPRYDRIFTRERHQSSEHSPRIDSTPSIAITRAGDRYRVVTSAIAPDGRLALQVWDQGAPVRAGG